MYLVGGLAEEEGEGEEEESSDEAEGEAEGGTTKRRATLTLCGHSLLVDAFAAAGVTALAVCAASPRSAIEVASEFAYDEVRVLIGSHVIGKSIDGLQDVCRTLVQLTVPRTVDEADQVVGRLVRFRSTVAPVSGDVRVVDMSRVESDRARRARLVNRRVGERLVLRGELVDDQTFAMWCAEIGGAPVAPALPALAAPAESSSSSSSDKPDAPVSAPPVDVMPRSDYESACLDLFFRTFPDVFASVNREVVYPVSHGFYRRADAVGLAREDDSKGVWMEAKRGDPYGLQTLVGQLSDYNHRHVESHVGQPLHRVALVFLEKVSLNGLRRIRAELAHLAPRRKRERGREAPAVLQNPAPKQFSWLSYHLWQPCV